MRIIELTNKDEKEQICRTILTSLPEWFGLPDSLNEYCVDVRDQHFLCVEVDDKIVGFLSSVTHNLSTIEIHVMGILPEYHRQGIGRFMMQHLEQYAIASSFQLIEVKTLDAAHPDKYYALTRSFYEKIGFLPLECIPKLWGEDNPCLIMVKPLK